MSRIPVILDYVVDGVLTPIFGVSSTFACQMGARNGLSITKLSKLNFGFWAGFGRPKQDPGARKLGVVHRDHEDSRGTRVGQRLVSARTRDGRWLAE